MSVSEQRTAPVGRPIVPPALRMCGILLYAAGTWVPSRRRADWRSEWWAELVHHDATLRRHGDPGAIGALDLLRRAAGCVQDAALLRADTLRMKLLRRRAAASRLARTPWRTTVLLSSIALPLIVGGTGTSTLAAAAGTKVDGGLVGGVALLTVAALAIALASAKVAGRALPSSGTLRDTAMLVTLVFALPLGIAGSRALATSIGYVSQDPVGAPPVLAVVAAICAMGALMSGVAAWAANGRRRRSTSSRLAPSLSCAAAVLAFAGALGLLGARHEAASRDLGYDPDRLFVLGVSLPPSAHHEVEDLLASVRTLPTVEAASATTLAPLSRRGNELANVYAPSSLAGDRTKPGRAATASVARGIASQYFQTLGASPKSPREPDDEWGLRINGPLARRLGVDAPAGIRLRVGGGADLVAGVAPDIQHFDPEDPIPPILYYPIAADTPELDLLVRAAPDAQDVAGDVGRAIRAAEPRALVTDATSFTELLCRRLVWRDFAAALLGAFGTCCLGLALSLQLPARPGRARLRTLHSSTAPIP